VPLNTVRTELIRFKQEKANGQTRVMDAYEDVFSDAISLLSLHLQTTTGGAGRGYQVTNPEFACWVLQISFLFFVLY